METVLITGGSRGIGLALVRQFLIRGYRVVATFRGEHAPEALKTLKNEDQLVLKRLEVTDEASINKLAASLKSLPIDILINNAGILGPVAQTLKDTDKRGWLETLEINTVAPLLVCEALLSNVRLSEHGRIITISSQMGALSRHSTGMYAYRSSKAAVNKVMQVLALELKDENIAVCPVHPGWVKTEMGGEEADITPEESAEGIANFAVKMNMSHSGKFYTWDGFIHEW
ncbi:SDR family oxidoreductase [Thaumasiovibrio subtropicus]|uniref:SDR family oxidoreductase n=1 Tax=Thaumasiovibrio subtropicus TaxID=1891207 RepID=UPI000B3512E8|nr:SDR family oxidoreductase [Thaumasiovibrio subtropicus]